MTELHVDFETRSTLDLKKVGLHNYARHPTTDAWCMSYAFDDEPVGIIPVIGDVPLLPKRVQDHVRGGGVVKAHNAGFEFAIWNDVMSKRYGWPALRLEQMRCTMAMCYAMALPGALEHAAPALGLKHKKDMAGHRLMLQMASPKGVGPDGDITWWDEPSKLEKLYEYCKQDVVVEREVDKRVLALSDEEQELWVIDQQINLRGVGVDVAGVKAAIAVKDAEVSRLNAEIKRETEGFVSAATEHARLRKWIQAKGVDMAGVAKDDVLQALSKKDLPDVVRRVLEIRKEAGKSSLAKLKTMVEAASVEDRLHGMLQFHAAGTGRWGGRRVQLQNIPRWPDDFNEDYADRVIRYLMEMSPDAAASAIRRDIFLDGSVLTTIMYLLRSFLRAAPGKVLMAADYSSIESRGLAWLAGEEWKLDAFRDFDAGKGHEMYKLMAAMVLEKRPEDVTKDERQSSGKVPELACGYQGGVGAFQNMAKVYNVKISDDHADRIKLLWRDKNPAIVQYWYDLDFASKRAVWRRGEITQAGAIGREVWFRVRGSFLFCRLPSGRALCYPYPHITKQFTYRTEDGIRVVLHPEEVAKGVPVEWVLEREDDNVLWYRSVDSTTNKWELTSTYGGKLSENVTQAICRDLLATGIRNSERAGYPVVLHVHDEIVSEVPEGFGDLHEFEALCSKMLPWAEGLPVVSKGWKGERYRK